MEDREVIALLASGAWLSDAGKLAYIRSADEMGDGRLVPPVMQNF